MTDYYEIDHMGIRPPDFPEIGESWQPTPADAVRYWHGETWYLEPPEGFDPAAPTAREEKPARATKSKAAEPEPELESDEPAESESEGHASFPETDADLSDKVAEVSDDGTGPAITRMETIASEYELEPGSLVEDARDFMLEQIKNRPKPWSATSEGEQRDVAAACEHAARELVRKVVEAVSTRGVQPVRVLLTKVNLGSDVVIAGKVKTFDEDEADQAVSMLFHSIGKHLMLIPASVSDYSGGRDPSVLPDEQELDFEAGGHPDDDSDLAGD